MTTPSPAPATGSEDTTSEDSSSDDVDRDPVLDERAVQEAHRMLHLVVVRTPQPPVEPQTGPLRLVLPGRTSPRPRHQPGPRPAETVRTPSGDFGPRLSGRADLPDAEVTGRRVLLLALEVLAGRRPPTQLQPVTSPGLYAALTTRRRPRWCTEGTAPLALGRVHVCEPVDGVAEVSAVARRGHRAHAVAARLEGVDGRWRCTALQVG